MRIFFKADDKQNEIWYNAKTMNNTAGEKTKLLFVCHGNICRSPMAEAIMKAIVAEKGMTENFEISSAAVSAEEAGSEIYPPAAKTLAEHGIKGFRHVARKMNAGDYTHYDRIFVMDESNMRRIMGITGGDPDGKISMLNDSEISDPWYSGDFEAAFCQIESGCKRLLDEFGMPQEPASRS